MMAHSPTVHFDARRLGIAVFASVALTVAVICVVSHDTSEVALEVVNSQGMMMARRYPAPQPADGLAREHMQEMALDREVSAFLEKYPTPQQRAMERLPHVQKQQMAAMLRGHPVMKPKQPVHAMAPPSMLVEAKSSSSPCPDPAFSAGVVNGVEQYNDDPAFEGTGVADPLFSPCNTPSVGGAAYADQLEKQMSEALGAPAPPPPPEEHWAAGSDVPDTTPLPTVNVDYEAMNAAFDGPPPAPAATSPGPAPAPAATPPGPAPVGHGSVLMPPPPPAPATPATSNPAPSPPAASPSVSVTPPPPAPLSSDLPDPAMEDGTVHGHEEYVHDEAFKGSDTDPAFDGDEDAGDDDEDLVGTNKPKTTTKKVTQPPKPHLEPHEVQLKVHKYEPVAPAKSSVDLAKQAMAAHSKEAAASKKIAALKAATHVKELKYKKAMAMVKDAGLSTASLSQ